MIYIGICDDNESIAYDLKARTIKFFKKRHENIEITVYLQSQLLQYDIEEGKYFDLILSDIEMPEINGMSLAAYIRLHLPETLIIFITSHLKYAIDAFELSIFRYIPKNALDFRLSQALEDAVNMIKMQSDQYYTIETPTRVEKIPYNKILYIQREGKNSVITMLDGSSTKVRKSLTHVFKDLDPKDFVYVDRGDIVNLAHIMGIKNGIVELQNGIRIPASQAKLELIKTQLSEFWGEHI